MITLRCIYEIILTPITSGELKVAGTVQNMK